MDGVFEDATAQLNRPPLYVGVFLSGADHRALAQHLAGRYRDHMDFEHSHRAPGLSVAA